VNNGEGTWSGLCWAGGTDWSSSGLTSPGAGADGAGDSFFVETSAGGGSAGVDLSAFFFFNSSLRAYEWKNHVLLTQTPFHL